MFNLLYGIVKKTNTKNLPDKFPIRYALVIENWDDELVDDEGSALNQFSSLLQKKPLDYSLLNPWFSLITLKLSNG